MIETPEQRVFIRDNKPSWRTLAQVAVVEIERDSDWQEGVGRVAVSTPGTLDSGFFAGRTVEINGTLQMPKGPAAEGLFDYRTFLRQQGIYYFLQVERTNDWKLLLEAGSPKARPWCDGFRDWAQRVLAKGLPEEDEPLRLLWAMVLGWKPALTQEVAQPFMRSGTLHIFAISGLHIALIAGILVSLLRVFQIPRGACGLVVIPLIWFYTAATGWQASAIRSTVMMTIVIGGWALKRPSHLLNSLAGAGFVILIWEPTQLFQAGFQLSFFVVLGLALIAPPFEKIRQWLLRTRPTFARRAAAMVATLVPHRAGLVDRQRGDVSGGMARFTAAHCLLLLHGHARQPRSEPADRAVEQHRAGEQPGQFDLWRLAALVHRTVQSQLLVLDEAHDHAERMGGGIAKSFLLRSPADCGRLRHLLSAAWQLF